MHLCIMCVFVQVLLDKLAQDQEKQMLEQENRQLRALLKQYLDSKELNH